MEDSNIVQNILLIMLDSNHLHIVWAEYNLIHSSHGEDTYTVHTGCHVEHSLKIYKIKVFKDFLSFMPEYYKADFYFSTTQAIFSNNAESGIFIGKIN